MSDQQAITDRPQAERKTFLPSTDELNRMMHLAKGFTQAGAARNEGEAITKIQLGWEAGIGPGAAITEISLIEGPGGRKPSLSPLMMRALVRMRGLGCIDPIRVDDQVCVCRVTRTDWPADRFEDVSFGIEEAVAAELMVRTRDGVAAHQKHKNYDKYRPDMFLARGSARSWRRHFPELAAGLPYCPEELNDEISSGDPLVAFPVSMVPALPQLKPLQPATEAPPTVVDVPTTPSPAPAPDPVDHFAAGLAVMDRRMVSEEQQLKARGLLTLLRFDMPTWKAFLKYHFGVETMKSMEEAPAAACIAHLDRLHRLELIRREAGVDDANLARALSKRGCKEFWQLSPEHAQEMISKMLPGISPFRLQQLGLAGFSEPSGGIGGNGSTPTAGANPPAMGPDALPQNQDLAPSITAPSLIPQAA